MEEDFTIPSLRIGRINSMNLLKFLVSKVGCGCSLTIFSYSITDGWMRQLMNLRQQYSVVKTTVVLDRDVMVRHREKLNQLQYAADEVFLSESHAKIYICRSESYTAVAVTSANATNNYRNEGYYITDRPEDIAAVEADVRAVLGESCRII